MDRLYNFCIDLLLAPFHLDHTDLPARSGNQQPAWPGKNSPVGTETKDGGITWKKAGRV